MWYNIARFMQSHIEKEVGMMKELRPIYLIYDSDVSKNEWCQAYQAVIVAAIIFGKRRCDTLNDRPRLNKTKSRASCIASRATEVRNGKFGPQRDASDICKIIGSSRRMREEDPFICVYVTSQDITYRYNGEYLDFHYSYSSPDDYTIVLSVARLRHRGKVDEALLIRGILLHEFGHLFDIVDHGKENTEYSIGLHCTNPGCIMNQTLLPVNELYANLYTMVNKKKDGKLHYFCPVCRQRISRKYATKYPVPDLEHP